MLRERISRDQLDQWLLPRDQWRPFPPAADRQAWEGLLAHPLNRRRAATLTAEAERLLGEPWPFLPAAAHMAFWRDGRRKVFEIPYFKRRQNLATLVLAECFEHQGRFVDEIINGLWAICEETSWCVSAHSYMGDVADAPDLLPRPDRHVVDLFAAETAMTMAEAWWLMGAELDAVTPLVRRRVRKEVLERVVDSVMNDADYRWLNLPMNWNPWCSSNVLGAGFYLLDDPARAADLAWQLMGSTDAFLAGQLPDGGCSEGPNYWGVAPGAMVILLELLRSRSGGKIDLYDEPLIADLGRYLPRVHLDGPWFATFADCPPRVKVGRAKVVRYGERIGEAAMSNLALLEGRGWKADGEPDEHLQQGGCGGGLSFMLRELFWIPADAAPQAAEKPLNIWLPDLQVMVARQSAAPGEGLVLAAKGGHNEEHHNHNDVGHFILVRDGEVVIADVGVGVYTRDTFNDNRYKNWSIRGSGHNAPVVNGVEQAAGERFAAADVSCIAADDGCELRMELAGAYPAEAKVQSIRRTLRLSRTAAPCVEIRDVVEFSGDGGVIEVNLFTPCAATVGAGRVELAVAGGTVWMEFDPAVCEVSAEAWPIDDGRLAEAWGREMTRLTARIAADTKTCRYALTFSAADENE